MNPEGGYTRQYRRMWDNPVFRSYQEAAVFSWMKDVAQWRETTIRTKFGPIKLGIGEFLMAEREVSESFGLHRNTLRTLLQRMADDGMIEVFRDRCPHRAGTIVRIVNYADYQWAEPASVPKEDRKRTGNGTEAGPKLDRSETKNNEGNTGNKDSFIPAAPEESAPTPAAAAKPVDPIQADAVTIRNRFLALRSELWPQETRFPAPSMTLDTIAAQWLRDGVPVDLALDVVERQMRRRAGDQRPAVSTLALFGDDVANALVSHRKAASASRPTASAQPAQAQQQVVGPLDKDRDLWVARMANWRKERVWRRVVAGPAPGEPGCRVPPDLLEPGDLEPTPTLQ